MRRGVAMEYKRAGQERGNGMTDAARYAITSRSSKSKDEATEQEERNRGRSRSESAGLGTRKQLRCNAEKQQQLDSAEHENSEIGCS